MAQKRKQKSRVGRVRAALRKTRGNLKTKRKQYTMRFSNRMRSFGRRFNPVRRFKSYRQQRSYSRPRGRSYGGKKSYRVPLLGIRIPTILLWVAAIGVALFYGKDKILPYLDKLKNKI